jgi:hypothetical protein
MYACSTEILGKDFESSSFTTIVFMLKQVSISFLECYDEKLIAKQRKSSASLHHKAFTCVI